MKLRSLSRRHNFRIELGCRRIEACAEALEVRQTSQFFELTEILR